MQRSLLFTSLFLVSLCQTLNAQAPDTLWTKTIGYDVGEYFTSIEQTSDGGFILAGFTESFSVDSSSEYWLVRLNSSADTVWTKVYPATDKYDNQIALQTADGGFAIAGDGDPWLIKTDSEGTIEWQQARSTLGAGDISVYGFVETADSGFVACGTVDHGYGRFALVVKTNTLGVPTWIDSIGSEHEIGALAIIETSDSGLVLAGVKEHTTGVDAYNGWLQKLSAEGDSLWSVVFGDTADLMFKDLQETADNGFIITGKIDLTAEDNTTSTDMYLVKTDSLGEHEWSQIFGGADEDDVWAVIQTIDAGYTMLGMGALETGGTPAGCWIIHTDADGEILWTDTVGDTLHNVGTDLVELGENEYLIAGAWIDFGIGKALGWIARLGAIVVAVDDGAGIPGGYALYANYPNPFNPSTTIGFDLPQTAAVTLTVYDILGREVRQLVNRPMGPGNHRVAWNGRTNGGREVPTGIYITRLETPGYTTSIKMVLLK